MHVLQSSLIRLGMLLMLAWAVPAQASKPTPDVDGIRALIAKAEAEGSRDLAASIASAQHAYAQAAAAGLADLALDAQLIVADSLLKSRQLDAAESALNMLRVQLGTAPSDRDHARYLVLHARWLRDLNRIDEAEQSFTEAGMLATRAKDDALAANVLNSHSAMLWRHGQLDRATEYLERALTINLKLGKENDANKNRSYLALIARDRGDLDRAQELNEQVLKSSEQLGDLRGIGVSANSIALLLARQDEMRESLEYFRRAADAYHRVGDPSGEGPALANIGQTLVKIGKLDEAEQPLRDALAMALASKDPSAEVISRSALAERALQLDQVDEAEREAMAAIAAAARLPARAPSVDSLMVMADVRRKQKRLPEAVKLRREALPLAREQHRLSDVRRVLQALAEDLAATGAYAESYQFQREVTELNSSMRDLEIRRQVAQLESTYVARQRQAEIDAQAQRIGLLEKQATQEQHIRRLLGLALAGVLLLTLVMISRAMIQRGAKRLLIERNALVERANRDLAEAADTDILTHSRNRRHFHNQLLPLLQRAQADNAPFALVLIDADHFKSINDRYGHDVGDRALIAITAAWQTVLAPEHALVRWGGEEFLVVAPGADAAAAADLVARGMNATRAITITDIDALKLSVSVGWLIGPWRGADVPLLLQACDRAMMLAKREGRDRAIGVTPLQPLAAGESMPDDLTTLASVKLVRSQ